MTAIKWSAASVFHVSDSIDLDGLQDKLKEKEFVTVNNRQLVSTGWVPPYTDSEQLFYQGNSFVLIRMRKEERILPNQVIADHMAERIERLEKTLDRKIRGKEKLDIRDNVVMELTPQAFTKSSYINVLIYPAESLMIVGSSSGSAVDVCTSLLRETLGSLPVIPIKTKHVPSSIFLRWLKRTRKLPEKLELGASATLQNDEDKSASITLKHQDLFSDDFERAYDGRVVSKVALYWAESVGFTLDEELTFTKLKFEDLNAEDDKQEDLDAAGLFDASVHYIALELASVVKATVDAFGGLDVE